MTYKLSLLVCDLMWCLICLWFHDIPCGCRPCASLAAPAWISSQLQRACDAENLCDLVRYCQILWDRRKTCRLLPNSFNTLGDGQDLHIVPTLLARRPTLWNQFDIAGRPKTTQENLRPWCSLGCPGSWIPRKLPHLPLAHHPRLSSPPQWLLKPSGPMFSCHVDLMLSHVDATAAVQTQKHM